MPTLAIVNVALFAALLGVLYQFGQTRELDAVASCIARIDWWYGLRFYPLGGLRR